MANARELFNLLVATSAIPKDVVPRDGQLETTQEIIDAFENGYDNVILNGAIGCGKSYIGNCVALNYENSYILTPLKTLQDQYGREFPQFPLMKGSSSYECHLRGMGKISDNATCKDKKCQEMAKSGRMDLANECENNGGCRFKKAIDIAKKSPCSVFNFAVFLVMVDKFFGSREVLIADEAHNVPDQLVNYLSLEIKPAEFKELGITRIDHDDITTEAHSKVDDYKFWLIDLLKAVTVRLGEIPDDMIAMKDRINKIANKITWLQARIEEDKNNWIVQTEYTNNKGTQVPRALTFRPIDISMMSQEGFLAYSEKRLFMSGTIDKSNFCDEVGLDPKKTKYIELESDFPVESRPFYDLEVAMMTNRYINESLPKIVMAVNEILDKHGDHKGIIHTHSFKICKYIVDNIDIRHKDRVIHHMFGKKRDDALEEYTKSDMPKVLISPSSTTGIDMKDDLCRFQIIAKVPYPFLGDKRVKALLDRKKTWYAWKTAISIIQAYGRGMRHKNDWCKTYMLDSAWDPFYTRNVKMFPTYFRKAVQYYSE